MVIRKQQKIVIKRRKQLTIIPFPAIEDHHT